MTRGEALAQSAGSFIGTKFRMHGRDPAYGLDCVGLVGCSLKAIGCQPRFPSGYALRNSRPDRWLRFAEASGLVRAHQTELPGDVLLTAVAPGQWHLLIFESGSQFIHAHAGMRAVVRQILNPKPIAATRWRLSS